jgi:hypothetical protein
MDEQPSMFGHEEVPDELQGFAMNPRTYLTSGNGATFASLPLRGAAPTDKYWKEGTVAIRMQIDINSGCKISRIKQSSTL